MRIFLFDVDGTIAESGQLVKQDMINLLKQLSEFGDLGIVGGGTYDKIKKQLGNGFSLFKYIFAESGSAVYINDNLIHQNKIREHQCYKTVNYLKRIALKFLSNVDYELSGTLLDQRDSLLYISLIGIQANISERTMFIELDKKNKYRENLLELLNKNNNDETLEICFGGSAGIAVHPKEWNKAQILKYINYTECEADKTIPLGEKLWYDQIYYFGDKYTSDGNDYPLITHPEVNGIKVDSPDMTYLKITEMIKTIKLN
jgi:HAD superfamily hydrolase (TIGR01484 family)